MKGCKTMSKSTHYKIYRPILEALILGGFIIKFGPKTCNMPGDFKKRRDAALDYYNGRHIMRASQVDMENHLFHATINHQLATIVDLVDDYYVSNQEAGE